MFVIGYPKSGNTWLCYLLSYCLNTEYDDYNDPGVHPQDEYQRKYVKGGLAHRCYKKELGMILKTHSFSFNRKPDDKTIYLIRDGRDVMVSYYFYLKNFHPTQLMQPKINRISVLSFFKKYCKNNELSFSEFIKIYLPQWIEHIEKSLSENIFITISYEALKSNTLGTLQTIFEALSINIPDIIIEDAIEKFAFKRMAKRDVGDEDPKSFFRKGITGDWKNHFSKQDLKFFKKSTQTISHLLDSPSLAEINPKRILHDSQL